MKCSERFTRKYSWMYVVEQICIGITYGVPHTLCGDRYFVVTDTGISIADGLVAINHHMLCTMFACANCMRVAEIF